MLHHFTREFVLSAVFLCVLSRMTMYDCSSLTCATSSERVRTARQSACLSKRRDVAHSYLLFPMGLEEDTPRSKTWCAFLGSSICERELLATCCNGSGLGKKYPEVNLEIPTASEFSVADLEGHGHLIIGV